jgi:hypothetical protein
MGLRAPDKCQVERARQVDIIDKPAVSHEQAGVFPPFHRLPDPPWPLLNKRLYRHGSTPFLG